MPSSNLEENTYTNVVKLIKNLINKIDDVFIFTFSSNNLFVYKTMKWTIPPSTGDMESEFQLSSSESDM